MLFLHDDGLIDGALGYHYRTDPVEFETRVLRLAPGEKLFGYQRLLQGNSYTFINRTRRPVFALLATGPGVTTNPIP